MKYQITLAAIVCVVLHHSALSGVETLRTDSNVTQSIVLLEKWIVAQMEYRDLPGLAIGVVYDQDIVWAKGFGYADLDKKNPVTTTTIFRIASITKTFTSTAIMQLRDRGRLQLDDPVVEHLPWFTYRNRHPAGPPITIRHLLTHTSGLPREAAFPYWTTHEFPTREEMVSALEEQESIYETERKYKYSNLGIAILGEVIAAVSGQPYEVFVQENILDPLEMTGTSVFMPPDHRERLATGYGRKLRDGTRKKSPPTESKGLAPSANISSTTEDMCRYASFHLSEDTTTAGQILAASTLREMHRVHWLQPSWTSGRGLGFTVSKWDDRVTFSHGGWVGGHRSQFTVSPGEKVAVVVLTNADDGVPAYFANRAMSMLAPVVAQCASEQPPAPKPDSGWSLYVGRYSDPWNWDSEVLLFRGKLIIYDYSYPPESDPTKSLVELVPEGSHLFRMSGRGGNGELVRFELGADGKVERMKVGENYTYPVR
jgi:CubicO group peptidase (beta-lactamase class C family)